MTWDPATNVLAVHFNGLDGANVQKILSIYDIS